MKNVQSFQESCGKDQAFTSELESHYIGYLYQMILDLKQCDLVDTPYFNPQISYSSDLEEDVQYPQNLIKSKQKFYHSMENNEQDTKVKHPSQFYANYWCSLKYHCVMAKFIFSTSPTQVENEPNFSIAGFFS